MKRASVSLLPAMLLLLLGFAGACAPAYVASPYGPPRRGWHRRHSPVVVVTPPPPPRVVVRPGWR